jgi:hypothetical protein
MRDVASWEITNLSLIENLFWMNLLRADIHKSEISITAKYNVYTEKGILSLNVYQYTQ